MLISEDFKNAFQMGSEWGYRKRAASLPPFCLIPAPNFIKNLVFEGGPKINPRIVSIDDSTNLESHIENFNQNFSKLGITVEKFDVMVECTKELEKKKKRDYDIQDMDNKTMKFDYQWLIKWCNSSY